MFVKLMPVVNFTNNVTSSFSTNILSLKKIKNPTFMRIKVAKTLLDKKNSSKMLVKLVPVWVGLCGFVVLDELVVHELEGQRGLADATRPDHDDLVQAAAALCFRHIFFTKLLFVWQKNLKQYVHHKQIFNNWKNTLP